MTCILPCAAWSYCLRSVDWVTHLLCTESVVYKACHTLIPSLTAGIQGSVAAWKTCRLVYPFCMLACCHGNQPFHHFHEEGRHVLANNYYDVNNVFFHYARTLFSCPKFLARLLPCRWWAQHHLTPRLKGFFALTWYPLAILKRYTSVKFLSFCVLNCYIYQLFVIADRRYESMCIFGGIWKTSQLSYGWWK